MPFYLRNLNQVGSYFDNSSKYSLRKDPPRQVGLKIGGEGGIPAHSDSQPGRYTQNAALARVLLAPFESHYHSIILQNHQPARGECFCNGGESGIPLPPKPHSACWRKLGSSSRAWVNKNVKQFTFLLYPSNPTISTNQQNIKPHTR